MAETVSTLKDKLQTSNSAKVKVRVNGGASVYDIVAVNRITDSVGAVVVLDISI